MAAEVRQSFIFAWDGYVRYAWGHDALMPLSRQPHDWYAHSLLMTPVDGYDTMILMGLKSQADSAKNLILDSLHFNYDMMVSNFETTIRIEGGLLSGYELNHDKRFLAKAIDLATRLLKAFHSPTGMPYRFVNLKTGKVSGKISNPAEIGSMTLEYGTLSKLTGNPLYFQTAKRAAMAIFHRRSSIGLVGSSINVVTGKWVDTESTIGSGTDSYYEYLLKGAILLKDQDLQMAWDSSIQAINHYLADSVSSGFWYGQANMYSGKINRENYGALDAYFAAVLALGGDRKRAIALQESNDKMWKLAGIEPEVMDFSNMKILNGSYALRPENMESCYYLYHFTQNPKYLRMAKEMFKSLVKNCRTNVGFAAIQDVQNMTPTDSMESFFFAETLKYAYLIFEDPKTLNFDQIIFNTEAHPFKRS
ncbi:MAG: glycoside hydrolase family 47 protein [Chitinophagaceae bacterium]